VKIRNKKTKLRQTILKSALVVFLSLALALANNIPLPDAGAATIEQELQAKQQRLKELENQISQTTKDINSLVKQQNTLQNSIKIFTAQISQVTTQIVVTETKIEIAGDKITELNGQIRIKENEVERVKQNLANLIRELYQMDRSDSTIMALMNNDNLSDFINAVSQIENVHGRSYELLQDIKELKVQLEDNRAEVQEQKKELEQFEIALTDQKNLLDNQVKAKNDLLVKTKNQESIYQALLAQNKNEEDKIQQEIQDLENKIRVQLGERTSPGKKGLFKIWPMNGTLTQGYGNTGFRSLGYSFHNGLDIAAAAGTPIYNVYDGTVNGTGSSDKAYGNWATVRYELPNGRCVVALYAHMLKRSVSDGQSLKGGAVIGTEGNTGNTTRLLYGPHRGFHLHFTVFDCEGFQIVKSVNGNYMVPVGYTYNPNDFL